jgi:Flp pilus assembly pilin Flp
MKRLREVYDGLGALLAYLKNEKGQTLIEYILIIVVKTLIEYILIIVVIALAIIAAYTAVGLNSTIETTLSNLNQKLNAP